MNRNENGLRRKLESRATALDPSRGRVANVKKPSSARFAEREVHGVDDRGEPERIVIWIERLPGALWAVGRAVNPQHRPSDEPRPDDYVFQGYELDGRARRGERHARATTLASRQRTAGRPR